MAFRPTVAIAGAAGNLGNKLTRSFLRPEFRSRFQDVLVLSRTESQAIRDLVALGAKSRLYNETEIEKALHGVDVLVNTIGPSGHVFKDKLLRAIPDSSVKLYFPSEFGVDHYVFDFPNELFDAKKDHFELAQQVLSHTRICRVFAGLFLEDSVGPWFGFDTAHGRYEAIGNANQPVSYTSMEDVGRAVAVLASSQDAPDRIHLNGDSKSIWDIARIMRDHGAGQIQVSTIDLAPYKQQVLESPSNALERYLRFLMGEGKIDYSTAGVGNSNNIVNKHEAMWKWRSMEDLAREQGGRPWADVQWSG